MSSSSSSNSRSIDKNMNNNRLSKCGNSSKENEYERPFKKARYMWQLKGKYYLKNEYQQNNNNNRNIQLPSKEHKNCENMDLMNYESNNSKTTTLDNFSNYIYSTNGKMEGDVTEEIPLSMVKNTEDNDDYLHKWQNKRIAQSFIDNTINMILENWKISPFDASDLVENCANGGQIEDEGILMAIQSHGLQSATERSFIRNNNNNIDKNLKDVQCQDRSNSSLNHTLFQSTMDNYTNTQNESINQELNNDCKGMGNDCKTDDSMDFLRTAVSVAIEKKGLSYTY